MTTDAHPFRPGDTDQNQWFWIAVVSGLLSLFCYFFGIVFDVLPWSVGRLLFYAFGPTLTLGAYAVGHLLRKQGRLRPPFQLGVLCSCIAGIAVNMMAIIQDTAFTMMRRDIAEAELEATKDVLRRILWGVNWVQLSFDIVFDIWIAAGCFFLALGTFLYLRWRTFGVLGMAIGVMALSVNFATLPHPPAEAGLFDPGPFVATWFGFFLGLIMWWYRRTARRGAALAEEVSS